MPELPEVETMRRGVAAIIRRAIGCTVVEVGRVGKRVIVRLDSGDTIVIEPRMTGLALVAEPPNFKHLRFRLRLAGGKVDELLYWDRRGLGSVRLVSPDEFDRQLGPGKVGPDALAATPKILRARLGASRRAIKVGLLDQRAIAGVGNLYASEILHRAALHPERPCQTLRTADWKRLHAALDEVLSAAAGP